MSEAEAPVWRRIPLSGGSLIEASAGTGKTWNIALLYLRLVLERRLGARQILVTTFTNAAAQELRARIRTRLLGAERSLAGAEPADAEIGPLLAECCAAEGSGTVLARLRLALADIDLAPISTIDSFCRRVLSDFPFETGVAFTLGEAIDEASLIRECSEDFWRSRYLAGALDPLEAACVLPGGPSGLASLVGHLLKVPAPDRHLGDADGLRAWWRTLCDSQLARLRELVADVSLYARSNAALRSQLSRLLACAEDGDAAGVEWAKFGELLEPAELRKQSHPSLATPLDQHPLLAPWSALAAAIRRGPQLIRTQVAEHCARFVATELNRRLAARSGTTFRQLIGEVHDRLGSVQGEALAACLRETWPVALIDEFQDTDARQWAIFERIYQRAPEPQATALVLIGDPKQSIYAFRGADIHAYLAAREQLAVERRFSIDRNFRSHPRLLEALNALYGLAGEAGFGSGAIRYLPVTAGNAGKFAADACAQALRLRLLSAQKSGVGERDPIALTACADDIVALLADPAGGTQPGDIAVLIDSNQRIEQMRELLIERGVPVVGAGRASVFRSRWADDLQLLLYALLPASDEYAIRAALATRLCGATARDLGHWAGDGQAWERQLDRFAAWRQLWERRGALAVIEAVSLEQAPRLLARADGERALTDLRHLGETLQEAANTCYGPEELYAWFVAAREGDADSVEAARERQLRIESESRRVQLLTIHASKGLEYPVVFIPTAWRAPGVHNQDVRKLLARYHDAAHRQCLDLGTQDFDAHKSSERFEGLQEQLRTLYVALTRAISRCIVYAFDDIAASASIGDARRGALEILLGRALHAASADMGSEASALDRLAAAIPALRIDRHAKPGARYQAAVQELPVRVARSPLPTPRPRHRPWSFTALTRLGAGASLDPPQRAGDEPPDPDTGALADPAAQAPDRRIALLAHIKGPRFGDALHQLLERGRDGADLPAAQRGAYALQTDRIAAALDQESVRLEEGQEGAQLEAIAAMLDRTLDTPLAPGLRLSRLAPGERRPEFEFAFAIDEARWHALHPLLAAHGLGHWWPAGTGPQRLRGLMKGSVDLVFAWQGRYHVLDYKTNWLGQGQLADYRGDALESAMHTHHYGLQALIYTLALHRYLGHRLADYDPDIHLGESWYLFIRGIGLEPASGIWRKRVRRALIEALDQLFEGEASGA